MDWIELNGWLKVFYDFLSESYVSVQFSVFWISKKHLHRGGAQGGAEGQGACLNPPPTFSDLLNGSLSQFAQICNKKLHEKKYPPWAPSLFRWLRRLCIYTQLIHDFYQHTSKKENLISEVRDAKKKKVLWNKKVARREKVR